MSTIPVFFMKWPFVYKYMCLVIFKSCQLVRDHISYCATAKTYHLMQNRMELFWTTTNLFVWPLRLRVPKSTVTPLLTLGCQNVKSVNHYKYLGIVLDTEHSDDKTFRER